MQNSNKTSPWIKADPTQWASLMRNHIPKTFKKNSIIYYQGYNADYIYMVMSGRVRITTYSKEYSEKQMYIAEQGCLFGEVSALSDSQYQCSAVAIVDSLIYQFLKNDVIELMRHDWELNMNILQSVCRKNIAFQRHIADLSFTQAQARIAQLLIYLSEVYGEECLDNNVKGIRIKLRFSHQDVANMVNTTRVTVSNVFADFTRKGILDKPDKYLIIVNMHQLSEIASPGFDNI